MAKTAEHGFPRWYKVGGVETRDPTQLKALASTVSPVSSNRYDSFDSPRGTSYQVPTGKTLYITKLQGSAEVGAGTAFTASIGYGDSHVEDSVTGPTSGVLVWSIDLVAANGLLLDLDVWIPIPAGKYPYFGPCIAAGIISVAGIEV